MTGTIAVYEPLADVEKRQDALAERPASYDGKVIALLNNTKDLVDVLLDEVKAHLAQVYPGATFRNFRKESVSGASAEMLADLARCDAVVTALGD